MLKKFSIKGALCLSLFIVVAYSGCIGMAGPTLGVFSIPVPVSPYFQGAYEDMAFERDRYNQIPILPPITTSVPCAIDPPSDDEVMRLLEKAKPDSGGVPFLETRNKNDVRIVKELIADYVDPPRVFPLTGPVQVHHAHYKCTVYYEQTIHVGWPIPYTMEKKEASEVIYIDKDHLHMVGTPAQDAFPQQGL